MVGETMNLNFDHIQRHSTLTKALKVTINIHKAASKFLHRSPKCQQDKEFKVTAIQLLVQSSQHQYFADEIKCLNQQDAQVANTSELKNLYPFLDDGVLKVGGRLAAADCLREDTKYPMIIPAKSHLAKLIVRYYHEKTMHSGLNVTFARIREMFRIVGAREFTAKFIRNCVTCFRFNSRKNQQLMGDFPSERVNPSPPFLHVGIDFARPIIIKKNTKVYCVIFVCFSTKAIHLDIAQSLTTQDCLKAIRRFIARRGCPEKIYTDNGTNFEMNSFNFERCYKKNMDKILFLKKYSILE